MMIKDHTKVSTVFSIISIAAVMFVLGLQVGRYITCETVYKAGNLPLVTFRDGVLLWHPMVIVPESEIDHYRSEP